ncbi:MAG: hypothetical protein BBJ60_09815 [Desulfobacterales bacterium S7086C20]|nr:MAG: hypothetical protein BBJ60_09815 [Desulfobacterales bacterium S7086C20]
MSKNSYQEKIATVKQFTPFQTAKITRFLLVSIHKWHILAQYGVLRGFAPVAYEKVILDAALLRLRCYCSQAVGANPCAAMS